MTFTYTSKEDGQVIESETRIDYLEGIALWDVVDSEAGKDASAPEFVWDSMSPNPQPVAGPVNTVPVTGGNPPLVSAGAGISNPAETLTAEEAARKSAESLAGGAPAAEQDVTIPDGEPTDKWAVSEIKAYATREGIDLGEAKNKGEYLTVIAAVVTIPDGEASDEWTIPQLTAYAEREGIDLDGATLKDDILAKVAPKQ